MLEILNTVIKEEIDQATNFKKNDRPMLAKSGKFSSLESRKRTKGMPTLIAERRFGSSSNC